MKYILERELFYAKNNITHPLPKCKYFLKKNAMVYVHLENAGNDAHIFQFTERKSGKWAKNAIS